MSTRSYRPRTTARRPRARAPRATRVAQGVVAVAPAPAPAPKKKGLFRRMVGGIGRALKPVAQHAVGIGQQMAIRKLNTISGHGDYTIQSNSLMRSDGVPMFQSGTNGVVVCHREFIQDIYSSQDFVNNVFPIQPASSSSFPWLSAIAQNFEQYRITGMIYEFKTTSADALNSTNTALGSVILSTNYNALAPPFINKQQMENNFFTSSTKPSMSVIHAIECAQHETPNQPAYVRLGTLTNGDLRLYDLGNFQIATIGFQNETPFICGELWVSYRIQFYKPQLSAGLALEAKTAQYQCSNVTQFGVTNNAVSLFDSIGLELPPRPDFASAQTEKAPISPNIIFPEGTNGIYQISFYYTDTASVAQSLGYPFLVNCSYATIYQNYTASAVGASSSSGFSSSQLMFQFTIVIENPALKAEVYFTNFANTPVQPTLIDIIVAQLNGNLPLVPAVLSRQEDYHSPNSIGHFQNKVKQSLLKAPEDLLLSKFRKFMLSESKEDEERDLSDSEIVGAPPTSFGKHLPIPQKTPKGSKKT